VGLLRFGNNITMNGPKQPPPSEQYLPGGRTVGEPFNPWHKACGFYPPDIVARQRDLTDGQKRLYERAVRWAGRNGRFWYGFETIAEALGKSVRQVKRDMAELEARGLIGHTRRRYNSNLYIFPWHSIFEVPPTALQEDALEVPDSSLEVPDTVILKVPPTAQESSPLESCPLNSGKADIKLIPDDASQKARSAASPWVRAPERTRKDEDPPADFPEPPQSDGCQGWTPGELAEVRRQIAVLWGREPEVSFETSIMLRARGATAAEVCDLFNRKFSNPKCRIGGRWAPKNQNWFLTVIENEFSPGHLPEQPAVPRPEHRIQPEDMNRAIEVIELPNASRSLVESVRCSKCGGSALARYTDGTIEGCGCRTSNGEGLTRISPASEKTNGTERKAHL
jgi:DNA-binding Lrp family transcriptional regulator